MSPEWLEALNAFIVRAKANTYIGNGAPAPASRLESHDLRFADGTYAYLDSYFGGTDFLGQEVVYEADQPVWAMNYYGRILKPDLITAAESGQILKESLSQLYREGRFLGGFEYQTSNGNYTDTNEGDVQSFTGKEWITRQSIRVYELVYHGGLIKA